MAVQTTHYNAMRGQPGVWEYLLGGTQEGRSNNERGYDVATKDIASYTVHFIPAEEGGYIVEVPALEGCVTEGDTFEEAEQNAREAISLYLGSLQRRGLPLPDATW